MSHRLKPQPDCANAWLEAARFVNRQTNHEAYNVMFDVMDPIICVDRANPIVSRVEHFLGKSNKSIFSVANTIFPRDLYRRHGAGRFVTKFHSEILPKVRKSKRWSGYYFERMTLHPTTDKQPINQIANIIDRIRDPNNISLNKFEVSIFDPERDVDNSPYGGQCLSLLSFKILSGTRKKLTLTAIYRNHYYVEKLLGNLIGLGWLMDFVATQSGVAVGSLTVLSTHAKIDKPRAIKQSAIDDLLKRCAES